jgi:RHS repeat-associated protein
LPQALSSATYNANNQLTQWASTSLTYDLNGNLSGDGTNSYTWNARNQLTSIGSLSFAYDAFGRRTQNAAAKSFLYDGANVVQELSSGSVSANLLTGLGVDETFGRTDSTGARYFLGDALGSTLALADSAGTVQTQYTYEPFGNTATTGLTSSNTFEYTGRENDGTGLYYNRARYYNPTWERFISEDPIGLAGGDSNFYSYVLNDPITFSDISGLQRQLPTGWRPAPGQTPQDFRVPQPRPTPQFCPRPTPAGPLSGQPEPADLGRTWTADAWEALGAWLDGMASGGTGLTMPFAVFPPGLLLPGPLSPRKPCWI